MSSGFLHLHVRGGHSYGFGVATPEELVAVAKRLALTDRDGDLLHHRGAFLRAGRRGRRRAG